MQSFPRNYRLATDDLNITFMNNYGYNFGAQVLYNPYSVTYEIGYIDSLSVYNRLGPENRIPEKVKDGTYRANFIVDDDWPVATYTISWKYKICQFSSTIIISDTFQVSYCLTGGANMGLIVVIGCSGGGGATGIQGLQYNQTARYQAVTSLGEEVWLTSSSATHSGLTWSRTGTTLTLNSFNHGLSVGNMIIAKYVNVDFVSSLITGVTADTFDITVPNSGDASGASGVYNVGFNFAHTGNPKTGGVLSLPSGPNTDIQLSSMRIRTGQRAGTTYELVVPTNSFNAFGKNTGLGDTYVPGYSVRQDVDNLAAVGATIITNIMGSYATFRLANLGIATQSRYIILDF